MGGLLIFVGARHGAACLAADGAITRSTERKWKMRIIIATVFVLLTAGAASAADCKFSGKWVDTSPGGYPVFDCGDGKQ